MSNLNKVMLIGNLTRDPELRYTASGNAIAKFGLAINRKWTGKDGQKGEDTCFVDVSAWGRQGENVAQYLKKGSSCFIEGRLEYSKWETQDGKKHSKLEVVGERVQFLDGRGGSKAQATPSGDTVEDDIPF